MRNSPAQDLRGLPLFRIRFPGSRAHAYVAVNPLGKAVRRQPQTVPAERQVGGFVFGRALNTCRSHDLKTSVQHERMNFRMGWAGPFPQDHLAESLARARPQVAERAGSSRRDRFRLSAWPCTGSMHPRETVRPSGARDPHAARRSARLRRSLPCTRHATSIPPRPIPCCVPAKGPVPLRRNRRAQAEPSDLPLRFRPRGPPG